ncbi:Matrix metalloproteinase-24 [Habropoda laboriosa]|uniref:Matrix metalloproteinase-24 n=1 Tax=Habropoda laboriosa TaxID=597456 RepID=A0A0L7R158_9HYME|nr:Matrix metalloproteinase-24 [Habropoda laboriosa]
MPLGYWTALYNLSITLALGQSFKSFLAVTRVIEFAIERTLIAKRETTTDVAAERKGCPGEWTFVLTQRFSAPLEPDVEFTFSKLLLYNTFSAIEDEQKYNFRTVDESLRTEQPSGLDTGGVRFELSRALDLWARNSKLIFQEVNSDRADILVFFHRGYHGDGYPFDGKGQILAHAFFPGRDRGGDVHFDEEEIWLLQDDDNEEGTSLFAVAAHEFGHSLGLAHSSVPGALMYPWYQGLSSNYELPEDDKHGIQQMYGSPEEKLWANLPSSHSPPERPTTPRVTTTSISTTYRPWKTRPTRPNHYPNDDRPRRPYQYPQKPDYRTERPEDRPQRPHKPHRHHTTFPPTTTTTTTTTTTMRTPYTQRPRHRWTPSTPKNDIPDKCDTSYDAISIIRREIFIFKGRYLWRIGNHGLFEGYPAEITRLFNLPEDIDHVDAVYERPDKRIVFFIDKNYYVFNANNLEPGYPKPLTILGLPESLEKVDGAMIWGYNGKTYFFSGSMYWRFDESENHVELDYPRDISMFAGVGNDIDAVFQWKDSKTYFFKGKGFWEFDDRRMKVAHEKQNLSAPVWMGCPRELETNDVENYPRKSKIMISNDASTPSTFFLGIVFIAYFNKYL